MRIRRELWTVAALGGAVLLVSTGLLSAGGPLAGNASTVRLPKPKTAGGMSLTEALAKRRTHREFSDRALSLEQISQLCWAAQGVTETQRGLRTAPSAGGLYPVTVFVVAHDGFFEYQPKRHVLRRLADGDVREKSEGRALGRSMVRSAPVCIVIAMDVSRTASKYPKDAERYCLLEAGHVAQNVLLQATAMDLVGVPVGGLREVEVAASLELPERLRPVYLLPVGYRTVTDKP